VSSYEELIDYTSNLDIVKIEKGVYKHLLVLREEEGSIGLDGYEKLRQYVEKCTQSKFPENNTIVIKFHPGPDRCNSGGQMATSKNYIKSFYRKFEKELGNIDNIYVAHIAKTMKGLKQQQKIIPWVLDIDGQVEELFFKYHYPCSSYVVINSNGFYRSFFGETSLEQFIQTIDFVNNQRTVQK